MKVLILGGEGQLGTDLVETASRAWEVVPLSRGELDITDGPALARCAQAERPQWIINTAAYNRTEEAERHREDTFAVNAQGALNAANAASRAGARLVHLSSDFVFDGKKDGPYLESDPPHPLNVYGDSKREGERLALAENPAHIVVRTASLFGRAGSRAKGGNIVEKILAKARAKEALRFVEDIRMSPTYTRDLAEMIWRLIQAGAPGGIYHVANAGECSWREFAQAVVDEAGLAARVAGMPSPAGGIRRAPNSALASERLAALGLPPLRPWREALAAYLRSK